VRCRICKKEIKSDWSDPAAGLLIDCAGERVVVGIYHYSCLVKRIKELIEGKEKEVSKK